MRNMLEKADTELLLLLLLPAAGRKAASSAPWSSPLDRRYLWEEQLRVEIAAICEANNGVL